MKVSQLIATLQQYNSALEIIVSSQGETLQIPLEVKLEEDHSTEKAFLRLYTDNGEDSSE